MSTSAESGLRLNFCSVAALLIIRYELTGQAKKSKRWGQILFYNKSLSFANPRSQADGRLRCSISAMLELRRFAGWAIPMGADIQTQAAYRHFRVLLSHGCKITVAFARIVTLFARFRLPERLPREGLHRADRHAFATSAAALFHRFPGDLERRIGKDRGPTHSWP